MSGRKIVFLGDCQAGMLMQIYRDFVAPLTGDKPRWVNAGHASAADLQSIRDADAVVAQVFNVARNITAAGMRPGALKVEFPSVFIGFLWPFSGQAEHVRNTRTARRVTGPYPGQIGDTFLNRLISEGVAAEEALQRYLDLDIGRTAHLDRLLELHLGAQDLRDERTGFAFARSIEAQFRDVQLFLTSSHPTLPLARPLIRGVFERLGVAAPLIDTAVEAQRTPPFPNHALPIHPGVIRHFGLRFADAQSRYPYNNEGSFTFAEFVIRYMAYTWNEDLAEGMALAHGPEIARARTLLERALQASPESAGGWRMLGVVLRRLHCLPEARAAALRAICLAPEDPHNSTEFARLLLAERDLAGAEAAARQAIAIFPAAGQSHQVLASILSEAGRTPEAAAAAQRAVALAPGDAGSYALLGRLLQRLGDGGGAKVALRKAAQISAASRFERAQTLLRTGKTADALVVARELLASDGGDPHGHALLGRILARQQDAEGAEAAFRKAIELNRSVAGFRAALAHMLAQQGKDDEALALLRELVAAGSRDPHVHALLGRVLARRDDLDDAVAAYTGALELQPSFNANLQKQLAAVQERRRLGTAAVAPPLASAAASPGVA